MRRVKALFHAAAAGGLLSLASCGGGETSSVQIRILEPSSTGAHTVAAQELAIGGTVSGAAFVEVRNLTLGTDWPGYVTYFDGQGSWTADVYGLAPGPNTLEAVADHDGTGRRTARDRIVVTRRMP